MCIRDRCIFLDGWITRCWGTGRGGVLCHWVSFELAGPRAHPVNQARPMRALETPNLRTGSVPKRDSRNNYNTSSTTNDERHRCRAVVETLEHSYAQRGAIPG